MRPLAVGALLLFVIGAATVLDAAPASGTASVTDVLAQLEEQIKAKLDEIEKEEQGGGDEGDEEEDEEEEDVTQKPKKEKTKKPKEEKKEKTKKPKEEKKEKTKKPKKGKDGKDKSDPTEAELEDLVDQVVARLKNQTKQYDDVASQWEDDYAAKKAEQQAQLDTLKKQLQTQADQWVVSQKNKTSPFLDAFSKWQAQLKEQVSKLQKDAKKSKDTGAKSPKSPGLKAVNISGLVDPNDPALASLQSLKDQLKQVITTQVTSSQAEQKEFLKGLLDSVQSALTVQANKTAAIDSTVKQLQSQLHDELTQLVASARKRLQDIQAEQAAQQSALAEQQANAKLVQQLEDAFSKQLQAQVMAELTQQAAANDFKNVTAGARSLVDQVTGVSGWQTATWVLLALSILLAVAVVALVVYQLSVRRQYAQLAGDNASCSGERTRLRGSQSGGYSGGGVEPSVPPLEVKQTF